MSEKAGMIYYILTSLPQGGLNVTNSISDQDSEGCFKDIILQYKYIIL